MKINNSPTAQRGPLIANVPHLVSPLEAVLPPAPVIQLGSLETQTWKSSPIRCEMRNVDNKFLGLLSLGMCDKKLLVQQTCREKKSFVLKTSKRSETG